MYSCGLNNHGQLGLGSAPNKDLPTFVRMLENCVCQVPYEGEHYQLL